MLTLDDIAAMLCRMAHITKSPNAWELAPEWYRDVWRQNAAWLLNEVAERGGAV